MLVRTLHTRIFNLSDDILYLVENKAKYDCDDKWIPLNWISHTLGLVKGLSYLTDREKEIEREREKQLTVIISVIEKVFFFCEIYDCSNGGFERCLILIIMVCWSFSTKTVVIWKVACKYSGKLKHLFIFRLNTNENSKSRNNKSFFILART